MKEEINSKENLEKEKLSVEIRKIKHPLLRRLSFYSALSPIIVSITAIIFSISTGLFEKDSKILELKKANLNFEIINFQNTKDSLVIENIDLLNRSIRLNNIISTKNHELNKIKKEFQNIQLQFEQLKQDKKKLLEKSFLLQNIIHQEPFNKIKAQNELNEILKILEKTLGDFSNDFSNDFNN